MTVDYLRDARETVVTGDIFLLQAYQNSSTISQVVYIH